MKVLKKEWFEGKDCLDIGCNSGLITITIGNHLSMKCVLLFSFLSFVFGGFFIWLRMVTHLWSFLILALSVSLIPWAMHF